MATSEHVPVERGGYDPAGVDAMARAVYAAWQQVDDETRDVMRGGARNLLDAYFAAAGSRQTDALAVPRALLESVVDTGPCWFDHHGGCQGHNFDLEPGETCPQAELRALLAVPEADDD